MVRQNINFCSSWCSNLHGRLRNRAAFEEFKHFAALPDGVLILVDAACVLRHFYTQSQFCGDASWREHQFVHTNEFLVEYPSTIKTPKVLLRGRCFIPVVSLEVLQSSPRSRETEPAKRLGRSAPPHRATHTCRGQPERSSLMC